MMDDTIKKILNEPVLYTEEEVKELLSKVVYTYHNWQHRESTFDLEKWYEANKK
jgi:hypothetical protein